jgi:chitinase
VPDVNHGLYQSDSGPVTDSSVPKGMWQDGAITYGDLEKYYRSSVARYWQADSQEPWLYDSNTGIVITYEDAQSLAAKADYALAHRLGGIMIWHVSDDAAPTLVNALNLTWSEIPFALARPPRPDCGRAAFAGYWSCNA